MNTQVEKLLDDIKRILKVTKRTTADLARDLDKNYHQVYQWLEVRRFSPQAEGLLKLQAWRDENRNYLLRPRRAGGRA